MAHKALIGGTAYEISGGKTLVGGTAYSVDNGKTLVGGTAYPIEFAEKVNISLVINPAHGLDNLVIACASATIDGSTYDGKSDNTTLQLPVGSVIQLTIKAGGKGASSAGRVGTVTVNGTVVKQAASGGANTVATEEYEYTVTANATIELTGEIHAINSLTDYAVSHSVIITEE